MRGSIYKARGTYWEAFTVYDHLNRAKQITQTDVADNGTDTLVAGKQTIITYNRLGQYTFLRRLADTTEEPGSFSDLKLTSYAYDSAARLTSMAHTSPGKTYTYTYDILDRIATFKIGSGSPRSYGYDGNSQLTNDGGTSYTYDENGNRTEANNVTYTTGADNRLSSDGVYEYFYDGEGNRIAKIDGDVQFDIDEHAYEPTTSGGSAVTYGYDNRNRMVSVISKELDGSTMSTSKVIYTYDVNDRLSSKEVDDNGDGTPELEESYLYDGDMLLLVGGDVNQFYLYGGMNEVLAEQNGSNASWAMADYQQNVRILLNGTGGFVAETDLDAFGNRTNANFDWRFGLHGLLVGASPELLHAGPRVVDTLTNGFLQQDAARESTKLYPYALNNPVNRHDRSGYFSAAHGSTFSGMWGGMYLSPQHNSPGVASATAMPNWAQGGSLDYVAPLATHYGTAGGTWAVPNRVPLVFNGAPGDAGLPRQNIEFVDTSGISWPGQDDSGQAVAWYWHALVTQPYESDRPSLRATPPELIAFNNSPDGQRYQQLTNKLDRLGDLHTVELNELEQIVRVRAGEDPTAVFVDQASRWAGNTLYELAVGRASRGMSSNSIFEARRYQHHVMTNKNRISRASGGPYTPKFERLAARRGITLDDEINILSLSKHQGPHPDYNAEVFRRMQDATRGLRGNAFNRAFDGELKAIREMTATPGTPLNNLATGQGR